MKKVFVNGSFDVLHSGHLEMLEYAASLGTYILIAIDTDNRIEYNKGEGRPFNPLHIRKHLMAMLKPVDEVAVFDTDEQLVNIIKDYSPDIMVKGSDWRGKTIIGAEYCKEVRFYERTNDQSSSKTIQDFIDRRQLL